MKQRIPSNEQTTKHLVVPPIPVPGTSYVILPDNRLARLLKVSVYNGKEYYNPIINGDLQRIARDELMSLVEKPKAD